MDLGFDVVDLPPADHPTVGEQVPDFTRPLASDEYWSDASLSQVVADAQGPTVLVFHPMAGSFPATYVWSAVAEHDWPARATVVGCSIATPYAHQDLLAASGVDDGARIFSDPDADVARQFGIDHDLDGMAGVTEHRPAVFVLDDDRVVTFAWVADSWPEFPPYDEIDDVLD